MYQEFDPHPFLAPYIDKYWIQQGVFAGEFRMKVFPDGCMDILFAFGDSARYRSMEEARPYLVGTYTTFSEELFLCSADMFGIRFKPAGITAFVATPVQELTQKMVELEALDSLFDSGFFEALPDTFDRRRQLTLVESYLLSKLPAAYPLEERILPVLGLIHREHGLLSPATLANHVCFTPRHFERRFKATVGLSPKMYSRIVRFNHARHYLREQAGLSLYQVALDCGYYDRSHLVKEFADFSGEAPGFFAHRE